MVAFFLLGTISIENTETMKKIVALINTATSEQETKL